MSDRYLVERSPHHGFTDTVVEIMFFLINGYEPECAPGKIVLKGKASTTLIISDRPKELVREAKVAITAIKQRLGE